MERPRRRRVYVNRDVEKAIFSDMVNGEGSAHVFLVQAESGMGKTVLLEEFWAMAAGLKRGRINLKQPDYEVVDILDDLVYQLGPPHFPTFRGQTRALASQTRLEPGAASDGKQLFRLIQQVANRCQDEDVRNFCLFLDIQYDDLEAPAKFGKVRELVQKCADEGRLDEFMGALSELRPDIAFGDTTMERVSPGQRRSRLRALTRSFFDDLAQAAIPNAGERVVLLFDGFEEAGDEVKSWMRNRFLAIGNHFRWLVIVVAGQSIPQLHDEWRDWWEETTLERLRRRDVREYVERLELQMTPEEIEVLYVDSGGIPYDLNAHAARWMGRRRSA